MHKILLRILVAAFGVSVGFSQTLTDGEWTYTLNESDEATITYYSGAGGAVVIPASVGGFPVKTVGGDYGEAIFGWDNTSVTSVIIGNGVTSIGDYAFAFCVSLTSMAIPDSMTSIGRSAFAGCEKLTELLVGPENLNYSSIGGVLFNKDATETVAFPGGRSGHYTIPDSVTSIGESAFSYCDGLTSVTIPDSVTSIGDEAFYNCEGLTSVTFGNGVTDIGQIAFGFCSSLTSVIIPDSVTSIGDYAFAFCVSLTSMAIPDSMTSIGRSAFAGCEKLTELLVGPDNLNYSSIGGVLFNKDATKIVAFPGGRSGHYTIPDGVTSIAEGAFIFCDGLTSVTIPDSVTSIGDEAFYNCEGLTSVTFGNGVTDIGQSAFGFCAKLTSITIPDSVTSIGDYAFFSCTGLTSMIIPDSVTSIGDYAFFDCEGLTSVSIGNSVTSIGGWAFSNCTELTSFLLRGAPPTVGEFIFDSIPENASVYYLPSVSGWGPTFGGLPTQPFIPAAQANIYSPAIGFQFTWSGTGSVPMNVRRSASPGGPWTVVSTNNSTGQFSDAETPSGQAFYQAYLP